MSEGTVIGPVADDTEAFIRAASQSAPFSIMILLKELVCEPLNVVVPVNVTVPLL